MAKKEKKKPAATAAPEGEAAEKEASEESSSKKGGKLKLIIMGVLGLVLAISIGLILGKVFFGGDSTAPPATEATTESHAEVAPTTPGADTEGPITPPARPGSDAHGAAPAAAADGDHGGTGEGEVVQDLGPQNIEFKSFIVNLGDGKRFLKLTMSVEAENEALAVEINQKMPQFRDMILLLLSSLSYDDISTLDGKLRLRNQIVNRINTQLSSGKVKNIYFSEFVVQ